jgi:prephenate dehydrogenase
MTVKIAIIGLGKIGASIGLALASHSDQVSTIGYDKNTDVSHKAHKLGAVENMGHGLVNTVKEADMVILALPLDQVHQTMQSMAEDVREEAVIVDTAPVKLAVAGWAEEFLSPQRHYVGLTLALNALVLDENGTGVEAARADLFQNGLAAVTAPHGTPEEAIKLAASFVTLLGARAYFADLAEVDGIMATIHTLPGLAAAALTEMVIGQPGWPDIRKLAGRPFVAGMRPLNEEAPAALAEEARMNRANTVRVLDEYIATLQSLRDEIDGDEKKGLEARLERALNAGVQWRQAREDGDWQSIETLEQEIPSFGELWKQQLGLGKLFGRWNKKARDN